MSDKFISSFSYKKYCVVDMDKNTSFKYDTFSEASKTYEQLKSENPTGKFLFESIYPDYAKSTTVHNTIDCNCL